MGNAVLAEGLVKRFGEASALDGLDLAVEEGTVLGLLGPNGAGKTTTVRILTTLLRPDAGRAQVAGLDVVREPAAVRRRIGLAGQFTALDRTMTGRENVVMFGRLYRLGRRQARRHADRLIERLDLDAYADAPAATYSGGIARRFDLASAVVAAPQVLFLDEPTTGLDPAARLALWDLLGDLVRGGVTLLLTTQYLEEADRLADRIAVVDRGRVIAYGAPDELKARVGGDRIDVHLADTTQLDVATEALRALAGGKPITDAAAGIVGVPAMVGGTTTLAEVVRTLDQRGIPMLTINIHRPTLDDVFLALTDRDAVADVPAWADVPAGQQPPPDDDDPTADIELGGPVPADVPGRARRSDR